jgi:hypothetical protein
MKLLQIIFPIAAGLLLLSSCEEDVLITSESYPDTSQRSFRSVHQDLWVHFENFEEEGALRNITVDLSREGIIGTIESINDDNVAGSCSYGGYSRSHVRIDEDFWNRASFFAREMIVFHELGHCFLFRDHLEGQFTDGSCKSIMRSGLQSCRDRYSSRTRDYYLDELFSLSNRK